VKKIYFDWAFVEKNKKGIRIKIATIFGIFFKIYLAWWVSSSG